jgi:GTP:adenosylcobinamide-phosphate guanylyltransferase
MKETAENRPPMPFTGVVLAADRAAGDPVARAAGQACKSLTPVGGRPMVLRVIDALEDAEEIGEIVLCGPHRSAVEKEPELHKRISSGAIDWVEPQATPSASTYHLLQTLAEDKPVLVTTADHALLRGQVVDFFCSHARTADCDVAAALTLYEGVRERYPATRRTAIKLKDGAYCSCNLFAFLTFRARTAADYWRKIENQRKKTAWMAATLGFSMVLRYMSGQLTLAKGLEGLSKRMGLRAGAVIMPFPEAAVDVDTVDDWRLVETIVTNDTS